MKPQHLRIGNLVTYDLSSGNFDDEVQDIPLKITSLIAPDLITVDDGYENLYNNDELKPIPLTEERLYKLAEGHLIEKINETTIVIDRFRLVWKPSYKYWYVMDHIALSYITKVEFVHEWQNLFFALNGEELELKS